MLGFDALAKIPLASLPDDGTQTLSPALFVDGDTFHAPRVDLYLAPALHVDPDTFFVAVAHNHGLVASLYTDPDTFYAAFIVLPPPLSPADLITSAGLVFARGDNVAPAGIDAAQGSQITSASLAFVRGDTMSGTGEDISNLVGSGLAIERNTALFG